MARVTCRSGRPTLILLTKGEFFSRGLLERQSHALTRGPRIVFTFLFEKTGLLAMQRADESLDNRIITGEGVVGRYNLMMDGATSSDEDPDDDDRRGMAGRAITQAPTTTRTSTDSDSSPDRDSDLSDRRGFVHLPAVVLAPKMKTTPPCRPALCLFAINLLFPTIRRALLCTR